jgi:hypothetical protein
MELGLASTPSGVCPPLKKGCVNKGVTFVWDDTTQPLIRTFTLLGQVPFGFWPIRLVDSVLK